MIVINAIAGATADGALPNAAIPGKRIRVELDKMSQICESQRGVFCYLCDNNEDVPAGRLNTPAPTIPLTRLKISLEIVAVPPPEDAPGAGTAAAVASKSCVELFLICLRAGPFDETTALGAPVEKLSTPAAKKAMKTTAENLMVKTFKTKATLLNVEKSKGN